MLSPFNPKSHSVCCIYLDILTLPLPNDTTNIQSINNARRLYDSCVNETAIESDGADAILSFINTQFGGWPILQGSSWNNSSFNLSNLLLKLREYNHNIIYSCGTSTDDKNSSAYYIRVKTKLNPLIYFIV
jgi:hypothetical protein